MDVILPFKVKDEKKFFDCAFKMGIDEMSAHKFLFMIHKSDVDIFPKMGEERLNMLIYFWEMCEDYKLKLNEDDCEVPDELETIIKILVAWSLDIWFSKEWDRCKILWKHGLIYCLNRAQNLLMRMPDMLQINWNFLLLFDVTPWQVTYLKSLNVTKEKTLEDGALTIETEEQIASDEDIAYLKREQLSLIVLRLVKLFDQSSIDMVKTLCMKVIAAWNKIYHNEMSQTGGSRLPYVPPEDKRCLLFICHIYLMAVYEADDNKGYVIDNMINNIRFYSQGFQSSYSMDTMKYTPARFIALTCAHLRIQKKEFFDFFIWNSIEISPVNLFGVICQAYKSYLYGNLLMELNNMNDDDFALNVSLYKRLMNAYINEREKSEQFIISELQKQEAQHYAHNVIVSVQHMTDFKSKLCKGNRMSNIGNYENTDDPIGDNIEISKVQNGEEEKDDLRADTIFQNIPNNEDILYYVYDVLSKKTYHGWHFAKIVLLSKIINHEWNMIETWRYHPGLTTTFMLNLEMKLSQHYTDLAKIFQDHPFIEQEFWLTAFYLNPSNYNYEAIKRLGIRNNRKRTDECGRWVTGKDKIEAKYGLLSSTIDVKAISGLSNHDEQQRDYEPLFQALSSLRLPSSMIKDIITVIFIARNKNFSWAVEWNELRRRCKALITNAEEKTRFVELNMAEANERLKYLKIDYEKYKNRPQLDYGSIEQGYENLINAADMDDDSEESEEDDDFEDDEDIYENKRGRGIKKSTEIIEVPERDDEMNPKASKDINDDDNNSENIRNTIAAESHEKEAGDVATIEETPAHSPSKHLSDLSTTIMKEDSIASVVNKDQSDLELVDENENQNEKESSTLISHNDPDQVEIENKIQSENESPSELETNDSLEVTMECQINDEVDEHTDKNNAELVEVTQDNTCEMIELVKETKTTSSDEGAELSDDATQETNASEEKMHEEIITDTISEPKGSSEKGNTDNLQDNNNGNLLKSGDITEETNSSEVISSEISMITNLDDILDSYETQHMLNSTEIEDKASTKENKIVESNNEDDEVAISKQEGLEISTNIVPANNNDLPQKSPVETEEIQPEIELDQEIKEKQAITKAIVIEESVLSEVKSSEKLDLENRLELECESNTEIHECNETELDIAHNDIVPCAEKGTEHADNVSLSGDKETEKADNISYSEDKETERLDNVSLSEDKETETADDVSTFENKETDLLENVSPSEDKETDPADDVSPSEEIQTELADKETDPADDVSPSEEIQTELADEVASSEDKETKVDDNVSSDGKGTENVDNVSSKDKGTKIVDNMSSEDKGAKPADDVSYSEDQRAESAESVSYEDKGTEITDLVSAPEEKETERSVLEDKETKTVDNIFKSSESKNVDVETIDSTNVSMSKGAEQLPNTSAEEENELTEIIQEDVIEYPEIKSTTCQDIEGEKNLKENDKEQETNITDNIKASVVESLLDDNSNSVELILGPDMPLLESQNNDMPLLESQNTDEEINKELLVEHTLGPDMPLLNSQHSDDEVDDAHKTPKPSTRPCRVLIRKLKPSDVVNLRQPKVKLKRISNPDLFLQEFNAKRKRFNPRLFIELEDSSDSLLSNSSSSDAYRPPKGCKTKPLPKRHILRKTRTSDSDCDSLTPLIDVKRRRLSIQNTSSQQSNTSTRSSSRRPSAGGGGGDLIVIPRSASGLKLRISHAMRQSPVLHDKPSVTPTDEIIQLSSSSESNTMDSIAEVIEIPPVADDPLFEEEIVI
ncbi:uncharacterized protein isoform X2 [Musca autumnalis]|uniref:uncharacterized protein isoform X2 n=1 Tax=Musca autumnalis TaxID=221902 RepID=UPI003CEE268C